MLHRFTYAYLSGLDTTGALNHEMTRRNYILILLVNTIENFQMEKCNKYQLQ